MKPTRIELTDLLRKSCVYSLTAPARRNFHPDFGPERTPKPLHQLGAIAKPEPAMEELNQVLALLDAGGTK